MVPVFKNNSMPSIMLIFVVGVSGFLEKGIVSFDSHCYTVVDLKQ